jgi:hypothetical protein
MQRFVQETRVIAYLFDLRPLKKISGLEIFFRCSIASSVKQVRNAPSHAFQRSP